MTSAARTRRDPSRYSTGRIALVIVLSLVALVAAAGIGLTVGTKLVGLDTVFAAITDFDGSDLQLVVRESRIPRTVFGLVVGLALGAAGAVMQGLTRNALADPGMLGVNAGASVAVAVAVAALGIRDFPHLMLFALAGALVATIGVVLLGAAGGGSPVTLVLAGVALAAVLGGITTALVLLNPHAFLQMRSWESGALAGRDLSILTIAGPVIAVGLVLALLITRGLDVLALGDDTAAALGVRIGPLRAGAVASVTLLAGTATAVAGPVAFLGLAAPHIARGVVGSSQKAIVPLAAVIGAIVVVLGDVVGRVIIAPQEVPVGIVMAFVAAPFLIWIGRRKNPVQL
ncbi:iron ABC transporter permease [Microbacterium sp. W4I20]|uniref:FecCD family ABC transporter permease n=1 Tax=Microbacterium sp. W4I20 TaxID=3042262 RepID=UPI00277D3B6E|nr:iron chelate uptake ABC transporter family permease subunit [Microbacterium sp. W4I20]MDQ0727580.1 iron complex transport system permease protein [Microbacterium sp. W4I20]